MIPKIVHYCWFGPKKKPKSVIRNIATWKRYFPNYKIIEWNEKNFDINQSDYVRKAYKEKKWAFVSDYVRMKALYQYGGVYFDTDVEVVKQFPKKLFELDCFTGFESGSLLVSPGLVFACNRQNQIIKGILTLYSKENFQFKPISKMETINIRITQLLQERGLKRIDCLQRISGVTVFPSDYFCGYDPNERKIVISENTLSVHHYAASWFPWYMKLKYKLGTFKRRSIVIMYKIIRRELF